MAKRGGLVLWGLLLLVWVASSSGQPQGILARHYSVSASPVNTNLNLIANDGFPARAVTFYNAGPDSVYVNVDNTGVAATTGANNLVVRALQSIQVKDDQSGRVENIGLICAGGESATVSVYITR